MHKIVSKLWQAGRRAQDVLMEGAGPAVERKVDADFFNRFGDPFDEDDMKPPRPRAPPAAGSLQPPAPKQ